MNELEKIKELKKVIKLMKNSDKIYFNGEWEEFYDDAWFRAAYKRLSLMYDCTKILAEFLSNHILDTDEFEARIKFHEARKLF